jgi:RNA polymerase sigma-70 factor (ECF subfamily)
MNAQTATLPFSATGPDEAPFIAALRAGEQAAFAALVRQHSGRVLSVTRRILGNEEDARDATQETFLAAFRAMNGFCGAARLSTWLHRIAVNCAFMKLRASPARRLEQPLEHALREDGPGLAPVAHLAAEDDCADAHLERRQLGEDLRAAISRLPESYRAVLLLRDIEELDTEEAARLLGISPTNVKVRLHRARLALRKLLAESPRAGDAVYGRASRG